ncbi:radical SAM/SPASM domain-containing protein [Acidobacteriota bacterium]
MKKKDHMPGDSLDYMYQGIIIFLNRRCVVSCASCNVNAQPGNKKELSSQWLFSFFNKVEDLKFSGYILWTGGEPFLSIDALKTGIAIASRKGYHSEVLTSASWFGAHPEWLELPGKDNLSIRVSLDAEHQEKVPLSRVIALIRMAVKRGIEINFTLREIPGQQEPVNRYIEEIKRQLPEFYHHNYHRSRWLHYIPHIPVSPDGYPSHSNCIDLPGTQKYKQPCSMAFRDLVLGEDGLVYPCCGIFGFSLHHHLAVGDPMKESWESLFSRQFTHPLFRMLKEKGPYGICREMNLEPGKWDWPLFQSPCHLGTALFKKKGEQVLKHFPRPWD